MTENMEANNESNAEESMSDFPDAKEFFLKVSLYTKYEIKTLEQILSVEFYQDTVDTFCVNCGRDSVFKSDVKIPYALFDRTWLIPPNVNSLLHANEINTDSYEIRFLPVKETMGHPQNINDYAFAERFFVVDFHCTREHSHRLFFSFLVKQSQLIKIGQYPSLADLQIPAIQKYRNVLSKEKYRELSRAIGLNANGVGVGSFVYLRRIFEDQLEAARSLASSESNWDDAKYKSSRVDEKILLLKNYLPEFLVTNRKLYGILSKGLHELSEADCNTYFNTVKLGIELILNEKIRRREEEAKIKEVSEELDRISSKLGQTS